MKSRHLWTGCIASALSLTFAVGLAQAQTITSAAHPSGPADGTLGPAASAAMERGRLLMNDADAAAIDAVTKAAVEAKIDAPDTLSPETGGAAAKANAPVVVGGHSFAGQSATTSSPSDSTGTIGPFSYIQTVNKSVRIYNRSTNAIVATGTLNQLAGNASTVNSFDPQIMWDGQTNRFYYLMDSVFSSTNNKLAFGFSTTSNPTNFTTNWCKYLFTPGDPARFPDYPKLGDSFWFMIFGVNSFKPSFVGSDLIAISKPAAGATCPSAATFKFGTVQNIKDSGGVNQTFTPVPANQVDTNGIGYVVARNGGLPSTKLWFYSVSRNSSTGVPIFGAARGLTVLSYTVPPAATQPTFSQVIDTLDARPTQAVQAINIDRGSTQSFWVQHTVKNPSAALAEVRWYEVNPATATPTLLRSGRIFSGTSHFYNAAISPDRRRDGATFAFGDSFVIQYNVSGSNSGLSPRIVAGSSFSGGAMQFLLVRNAVGPYRDFTCPSAGNKCRWGDYSAAAPDPRPTSAAGRGEVWVTNQYSGLASPSTSGANFRTWISAIQP
jgi:hypothetical protein